MWVWGLRFCVWMKDGNCTVYRNHVWHVWHVIWLIMEQHFNFQQDFHFSHTHQEGIPDEENGGVVASQVPVALFSVKLDRKASWISHGVCWPRFTSWKETQLSHESTVSAAIKCSNDSTLMHTSGVTHLRWRSGQRWVLSSRHVQTLWPCNSERCHESPRSSQTLLHYVRNNNIIVCFTCTCILKHSKSLWSS